MSVFYVKDTVAGYSGSHEGVAFFMKTVLTSDGDYLSFGHVGVREFETKRFDDPQSAEDAGKERMTGLIMEVCYAPQASIDF